MKNNSDLIAIYFFFSIHVHFNRLFRSNFFKFKHLIYELNKDHSFLKYINLSNKKKSSKLRFLLRLQVSDLNVFGYMFQFLLF